MFFVHAYWKPPVFGYSSAYMTGVNIAYIGIMVFLAVIFNSLFFFGLKHTKVNEAESLIFCLLF
ncbi:MAG: hypothetical protein DRN66_01590 [Candidatus Nanohalarchaeota archaeon]|nr:MAG: hypothetical protein DRN66_01590 [Candidatus Nanohaloarchaeota archaeon]